MIPYAIRSGLKAKAFFGAVVLALSFAARADLVVIVNPQSGVDQLTKTQVINIFLGNHRELPNGMAATPIDLPASAPEKAQFYRALVNKDLDQMAAYWSRLVFAGSTAPPSQASAVQDALQLVAANRGAISYVDRKHVDPRVRVVLVLP